MTNNNKNNNNNRNPQQMRKLFAAWQRESQPQQQQRGNWNTLLQLLSCCRQSQSLPLLLLRLLPLQFNWIHLCQFTINKATKEIKQKEMKRKLHNSTTKTEDRSSSDGTRPSSKPVIIPTVPQYLSPFSLPPSLCCRPPVSDKQTSGKATVKCFLINEEGGKHRQAELAVQTRELFTMSPP